MDIVRDLSVQLVIVTLPLLIYETFWLTSQYQRNKKIYHLFYIIVSIITGMVSVMFSVDIGYGYSFHFAAVPILLTFFYVNKKAGLIVLLTIYSFTTILDGKYDVTVNDYILLLILIIVIYPTAKMWKSVTKKRKIIYCIRNTSIYALLGFGILLYYMSNNGLSLEHKTMFFYLTCLYITFIGSNLLNVYLKEYIIENTIIRENVHKSEKLQIISELAASVAHEVRNPLTVVRGFIQLIEYDEKEVKKEYLQLVVRELDRAEHIISEYLNLASAQTDNYKIFNLSERLDEVCTVMSTLATLQGIYLKINIEDGLVIKGDSNRIKQAIMNVLKNGVEAVDSEKGMLSIQAKKDGKKVMITIRDNGAGMTQEQITRLGEPYYSLKEKGTGLGLMVTFNIIEAHKGKILYKSEQYKGTTVSIQLPLYDEEIETSVVKEVKNKAVIL